MSANVETMFYVRQKPWHGLGTEVKEAPTSADALIYADLDWEVIQKDVYTEDGSLISGYKANLRSTDATALGIVSDHYKVVQNEDAFRFTDDLLGAGVTYETAGALMPCPGSSSPIRRSWSSCPSSSLLPLICQMSSARTIGDCWRI